MIKILIVDNSEVIRNLLTDYLSDIGYHVDSAVNGLKGIEKALSEDFDLVLCDCISDFAEDLINCLAIESDYFVCVRGCAV